MNSSQEQEINAASLGGAEQDVETAGGAASSLPVGDSQADTCQNSTSHAAQNAMAESQGTMLVESDIPADHS